MEFSFKNWNLRGLEWWYCSNEVGRYIGFQDKQTALEDETKVKDLEQSKEITTTHPKDLPKELRTQKDLSLDNIICEISKGVSLALDLEFYGNNMAFVS